MVLAQLPLYRRNLKRGAVSVCVLVIYKEHQNDCFRLAAYRGLLENFRLRGLEALTKSKPQKHASRVSVTYTFDEYTARLMSETWKYSCSEDGEYRPTEDPPLAIDLMRAMRVIRSQIGSTLPPLPITRLGKKRRLLEFN